jgi:peptide/nickel transport system ATP-binding protein
MESSMSKNILSIENLRIKFNAEEVLKVDKLDLKQSTTLALVGESGSGKSLTSLAIMQLLPPNSRVNKKASITYAGKNILNMPEKEMQHLRAKRISLIFQEALSSLNPVKTIGKQIKEVLLLHKIENKNVKEHIIGLLNEVEMPNPEIVYDRYPHQLSGGMNQRAMIAMAIASKPQILIADEPTTALDVSVQTKIMKLLTSLKTKYNMSVIFITHNLSIVKDFADEVAVMQKGEIIELKSKDDFFKVPSHSYSKKLLEAAILKKRNNKVILHEDNVLNVKNLKLCYSNNKWFRHDNNFSINDINFNLHSGETLAIIGESGSGKTTIAKAILHLQKYQLGSINLFGTKMKFGSKESIDCIHNSVQMIFQNPDTSLNPRFTIRQILEEGLIARNICYDATTITKLLTQVGLEPSMQERYPHEFSGGQKQRICIARALSLKPKIIICDEPTSALDVAIQEQVISLLIDIQKQYNLSYILITHDFSLVSSFADRVIVMKDGNIVESGLVKSVLTKPKNNYTKTLLNSIPNMQSEAMHQHHSKLEAVYE